MINPVTQRSEIATALLDDGSNKSVISDKLAEELGLRACSKLVKTTKLKMAGVGGMEMDMATYVARVGIESLTSDYAP